MNIELTDNFRVDSILKENVFIANAAARVAATIATHYCHNGDISLLKNKNCADNIAKASVNIAESLAECLNEKAMEKYPYGVKWFDV